MKSPQPRITRPSPRWRLRFVPAALILTMMLGMAHAQQKPPGGTAFERHREEIEQSVKLALDYLNANQNPDGTYNDAYGRSTGIVALAGMAYLSAGHTPGYGPYSDNLERCIDYVLKSQHYNGLLDKGDSGHGLMYAHNIATLFLSEVSGMVEPEKQETVDRVLAKATKLILSAQSVPKSEGHQGGWRYKPDSRDSDLSCSGWALMALRSAKLNGAPVPDDAIKSAVEYVFRNHDKNEGRFGYTDPWGHSETLTGCGLLCLELTGHHGGDSNYRAGDYILKNRDRIVNNAHEAYANYYNAQAMFQLGGKWWEEYATWMYGHYLGKQDAEGKWGGGNNGGSYGTSMMVLSFTVPYRQLPIYQRDETVDEDS